MTGKKTSALRSPGAADLIRTSISRDRVERTVEDYIALHRDAAETRRMQYSGLVNRYYDLVTDFYEYGWGDSFHFAPRYRHETFHESLLRYQYFLALRLGLCPGMNVLDIGCGIGGPMRNIAQFSGCQITGINKNSYQVRRAEAINRERGFDSRCRVIGADFMSIPLPNASMDAAFSIEATVHAPNWLDAFSEIRRVLRVGAQFALYDWCLTDLFDHRDPRHQMVKRDIERGAGVADLGTTFQFLDALSRAGFDILDHHDHAAEGDIPWYEPLAPSSFTVAGFRRSGPGRKMTNAVVKLLELARVAPKGAAAVAAFLDEGAAALVQGGRLGIMTPMYFALARVPD